MTTDTDAQRPLARRLLDHEAGSAERPRSLAEATEEVLQKLYRQLSPIIGPLGVRTVLSRALQLTAREFPFIGRASVGGVDSLELSGLDEALAGQSGAQAMDGVEELLSHTLALLVDLLGQRLADRYIQAAWPGLDTD